MGESGRSHQPQQSKTANLLAESPGQPGSALQHLLTSLPGDEVKNTCENVWSGQVRELFLAAGWPFGRSRVFVYLIFFPDELV